MSRIEFYGLSVYADPSKTMVDPTTGETLPFLGEILPGEAAEFTFPEGKIKVKIGKKKPKKPLKYTITFDGKVIQRSEIPDYTANAIMLGETEGGDSVFHGAVLPVIHFLLYCKY